MYKERERALHLQNCDLIRPLELKSDINIICKIAILELKDHGW